MSGSYAIPERACIHCKSICIGEKMKPRGAIGRQRARPRGTWMEYAFEVEVTAKR